MPAKTNLAKIVARALERLEERWRAEAAVGRVGADCQYTALPDDKWRCSLRLGDRSVFVVFTEREDDNSGDGRPVGIVTAYYSPRGCPC